MCNHVAGHMEVMLIVLCSRQDMLGVHSEKNSILIIQGRSTGSVRPSERNHYDDKLQEKISRRKSKGRSCGLIVVEFLAKLGGNISRCAQLTDQSVCNDSFLYHFLMPSRSLPSIVDHPC